VVGIVWTHRDRRPLADRPRDDHATTLCELTGHQASGTPGSDIADRRARTVSDGLHAISHAGRRFAAGSRDGRRSTARLTVTRSQSRSLSRNGLKYPATTPEPSAGSTAIRSSGRSRAVVGCAPR
jgi:hypothetical protein